MLTSSLTPVVALLLAVLPCAADTVALRPGTEVNGTFVGEGINQVTLRDARGNFRTFDRADFATDELIDLGNKLDAPTPAAPTAPPPAPPRKAATPKEEDADAPEAAPELTEIMASGVGRDADAARKDALRQAVSQVVGTLVVASDMVANDQLIDSKILTYSDGYVQRYEPVGDPVSKDGLVRLKVRAWVRQGKLTKALVENNVPVREFDLRSMQGQSETSAQQARSAAEIVKAVFTGFPTKVLKAEALQPIRIDGDDAETIVEVPLRVTVDMAKWKAWMGEVKRALDPIAEAKGTENWNVRMAGWYPMASAKPTGKRNATEEPYQLAGARASPCLDRFVPKTDRANGVLCKSADVPAPSIASEEKRVVAILDKLGGKISWWKLPEPAWIAFHACRRVPVCHVRIVDAEGESIGTSVQGWEDAIESKKPGEGDYVIDRSGGIGRIELLSGRGAPDGPYSADFVCSSTIHPSGRWRWSWTSFSNGNPIPEANEHLHLHLPSAVGQVGYGGDESLFLNPTIVYPRRFRIPGSFADIANAEIVVEFPDP